jgi:diacylglycerol kinase (ATP)
MGPRPFRASLRDALAGLAETFGSERSFRIQVLLGAAWLVVLVVLRPAPVWWALSLVMVAAVLTAELVNTALEALADVLHPEQHPRIRQAKHCAAAAVLLLAAASVVVAALTVASVL